MANPALLWDRELVVVSRKGSTMPVLLLFLLLDTPSSFYVSNITTDQAVNLATDTLTQELAIDADDAMVVSALPVKWSDSSLGCPQSGGSYLQEAVPGYRVVFRRGSLSYRVHVGAGRAVLCRGRKTNESRANNNALVTALRLSRLAREDLVSRLGIQDSDIEVKVLKPMTWPDTSLGCPVVAGEANDEVAMPGFLIELAHNGYIFEYHADTETPFFCQERKR